MRGNGHQLCNPFFAENPRGLGRYFCKKGGMSEVQGSLSTAGLIIAQVSKLHAYRFEDGRQSPGYILTSPVVGSSTADIQKNSVLLWVKLR
jgi:hypothetical protein